MTGGALDLEPIKQMKNVEAIVWCGYPGQSGGQVGAFSETLSSGFS